MLSVKCRSCGGEMSVDSSGGLYCGYCGAKYEFSDRDLTGYRAFRSKMLEYLRAIHDQNTTGSGHEDSLWNNAETVSFKAGDGSNITVRYLYDHEDEGVTSYLTRKAALFVFPKGKRDEADRVLRNIAKVQFPPADVKGLADAFPKLSGRYELADGGVLLAFERQDNLFPLAMFGSLRPEHVAWVISRMENICCVLQYSSLVHGGISEESLWINPTSHHAVLMGHWWDVRSMQGAADGLRGAVQSLFGADSAKKDLKDLRKTADRVLGMKRADAPQALTEFLADSPEADAFADFEVWDQVIEKGFGGRRFSRMGIDF
ncbi:MAG: hypothetical protein IKZ69_06770 [Lachnospiraceae bacterium]|nr:hypothetical protein [Lachnospiraceae bacterium]